MSIERWVEWCRMRKAYLGWTAQQLSDKSGVALGSIERIFSGRTKDPLLSTVQLITKALVNGSWGQYPCADPNGETAELAQKCAELQKELTDMTERRDHFRTLSDERLKMVKDAQINMQDRKAFIQRKDKVITALGIALAAMTIITIFALGSDAIIPLF